MVRELLFRSLTAARHTQHAFLLVKCIKIMRTSQRTALVMLFLLVPTVYCLEDGDEAAEPDVRGNNVTSVSSINLCTDVRSMEVYQTLTLITSI